MFVKTCYLYVTILRIVLRLGACLGDVCISSLNKSFVHIPGDSLVFIIFSPRNFLSTQPPHPLFKN